MSQRGGAAPPRRQALLGPVLAALLVACVPGGLGDRSHAENSPSPAGDTHLAGRLSSGLAVDADRGEVVLFGGVRPGRPSAPLGDTWIYRSGSWQAVHPPNAPVPRYGASMAWDPAGHRVLLFGGRGAGADLTDTWAWNGSSWTRLETGSSGPVAGFATMATDLTRAQVVLHVGGSSSIQTWTWAGTRWRLAASGQGPQGVGRVAFDPLSNGVLDVIIDPNRQDASDTWQWDGVRWHLLGSSTSGLFTKGPPMAMDAPTHRLVLFEGPRCGNGGCFSRTWTWDGRIWTLRSQAHTPYQPVGMVTDPQNGHALLLAGNNESDGLQDMWVWNGNDWTKVGL